MTPSEARAGFARLLQTPEAELDVAEGALWIAAEEYPELRMNAYLDRLARMADDLRELVRGETRPEKVVETSNAYFFEELQLRGNRDDYHDPRNSYLNEVLDRKLGIPITLSIIYVAVGERAGLPVRGVGMPGHFLVKYAPVASDAEIFIDPYGARTLTRDQCAAIVKEMYGDALKMRPAFLEPSAKRQILARMLNNLKSLYMSRNDLPRALAASDRIMMTDPHLTSEWRDRGMILHQLRKDVAALKDLTRYLEQRPEPEDAERVRQLRMELLGRLN